MEKLATKSQFLSLACLQGLGRKISSNAHPQPEQAKGVREWAVFGAMCAYRQHTGDLSGMVVVDDEYNLLHAGNLPDDVESSADTDGARWMHYTCELLVKNPSRSLFVFFDTVMMLEDDKEKAQRVLGEVADKIASGEDGAGWLCENGGKKVTIATLMDIGGVQSQMMFGHEMAASGYSMVDDFDELVELVTHNSIPMIDENMEFLRDLREGSHKEGRSRKYYATKVVEWFTEHQFVWLDRSHSEPLMDMLDHFGLGSQDEIEEAIGKEVVRQAIGGDS